MHPHQGDLQRKVAFVKPPDGHTNQVKVNFTIGAKE